jgi:putative NADPH-quinone reductase
MPRKITMIQGHPDSSRRHLCHALADANADAAAQAGHSVARVEIAGIEFPQLRTQEEFNSGTLPASLKPAVDAIIAADHIVLIFPLWLGTMPALVKAFLEQVLHPGVAFFYERHGAKKLLVGRSAHIVATMEMPAWLYQTFFCSHGIRGLRRSVFKFAGFSPGRTTMFGMIENASDATTSRWLDSMRKKGAKALPPNRRPAQALPQLQRLHCPGNHILGNSTERIVEGCDGRQRLDLVEFLAVFKQPRRDDLSVLVDNSRRQADLGRRL